MTKTLATLTTVLLVHTAAAQAQQSPAPPSGGSTSAEGQGLPPAYAPPPGYTPPTTGSPAPSGSPPGPATGPAEPAPNASRPPIYATPAPPLPPGQPAYGPPPSYGPPPGYGAAPYGAPPYGARPGYPYSYYYYTPPPPPPRAVIDRPFTIGGGIGFGGLRYTYKATGDHFEDNGMAYTFRLGFGLRPGLLLMWDVEGAVVERAASAISQTAHLAAVQLFATRRLFLKGGLGLAQVVQDDYPSEWGGAGMFGLGYELVQGWNWSFDVEATATAARYSSNGSAGDHTWANWSLVNFAINFF